MTITEFLSTAQQAFGNGKVRLMPGQEAAYIEKLSQFDEQQIGHIYSKVLELTEHFPKVKHIYDAARELGYLQTQQDSFRPHEWTDTDCDLCAGEGRLLVIWELEFSEDRREMRRLSKIRPYSAIEPEMGNNEFRTIWRCSCKAAEAPTVPQSWPRWRSNIPAVSYA